MILRHERYFGVALLLVALGVRGVAAVERSSLGTFWGMIDTNIYVQSARALATTGSPDTAFFMSPLYPYLLWWSGAADGAAAVILTFQVAMGMGALVCMALVARRIAGPAAGLAALALGAVAGPLVLYDTALLPDGPATAALTMASAVVVLRGERQRWWWASGLAAAVAVALRSNLLLAVVALTVWAAWRKSPRSAWLGLAAPVVVALALIAMTNGLREGLWAPRSYNAGVNLYVGNNSAAEGTYNPVNEISPGDMRGEAFAQQSLGRQLNSAQLDNFWRDRALAWISSNPGATAKLVVRKLALFFHPFEMPQMEAMALARFESGAVAVARVGLGLLLPLFVCGWWLTTNRRELIPFALIVTSSLVICTVFFVNGRLRLPVWGGMIPVAAIGVAHLVELLGRRDWRRAAMPLGLGLVLVTLVSQYPVHATYYTARGAAQYASIEALAGNTRHARDWIETGTKLEQKSHWRGGRAIERTFQAQPASELLLRMERGAAMFALATSTDQVADYRAAFVELVAVADSMPRFRRAQEGLYQVCLALIERGQGTAEVLAAQQRAAQRLPRRG